MAFVYWIRTNKMTDMWTQGYIGFTSTTVAKRFEAHRYASRDSNYPIHHAIKKYGNELIVDTILESSPEYGLFIEKQLRPYANIGWNIAVGGEAPMLGRKHSEYSKAKIIAYQTGVTASEAARVNMSRAQKSRTRSATETQRTIERNKLGQSAESRKKISEKAKLRFQLPWNLPNANLELWSQAREFFDYVESGKPSSAWSLAKAFNYLSEGSTRAIAKRLKAGWNPHQDEIYLSWLATQQNEQENLCQLTAFLG